MRTCRKVRRPQAMLAVLLTTVAILAGSSCVQKIEPGPSDGSVSTEVGTDGGTRKPIDGGSDASDGGPPDACVPATCETVGAACGSVGDGCGGMLQCQCFLGQTCSDPAGAGTCGCPNTAFRSRIGDTGTGYTGLYNSLAVDAAGGVHLAYVDGDQGFKYLYHPPRSAGFAPTIETVESLKPATGTSLAVDAQGQVHVVYYLWDAVSSNIWDAEVWYARRSAEGIWTKSRVVAAGEMVYARADYAAVAIDTAGVVHLLYYTFTYQTADLWHATSDTGSGWSTQRVAPGAEAPSWTAAGTLSLRFDSSGALHALFFDYGTRSLRHATRSPAGAWSVAPTPLAQPSVSGEWAGPSSSLVIDDADVLHATWSMERTGASSLWYGKSTGAGAWQSEQVDPVPDASANVGSYNALARGADGTLHVVYYDAANEDLRYASRPTQGGWTPVTADPGGSVGGHATLGVDARGTLHLAYFELLSQANRNGQLRYASRCQ